MQDMQLEAHRVTVRLAGGQVPVPAPLRLCEDAGVLGAPFYVMAFVPGRVFDDLSLPELAPAQRTQVRDLVYADRPPHVARGFFF